MLISACTYLNTHRAYDITRHSNPPVCSDTNTWMRAQFLDATTIYHTEVRSLLYGSVKCQSLPNPLPKPMLIYHQLKLIADTPITLSLKENTKFAGDAQQNVCKISAILFKAQRDFPSRPKFLWHLTYNLPCVLQTYHMASGIMKYDSRWLYNLGLVEILLAQSYNIQWITVTTRINFNSSMDKWFNAQYCVGWNYLSILQLRKSNRWSLGLDK